MPPESPTWKSRPFARWIGRVLLLVGIAIPIALAVTGRLGDDEWTLALVLIVTALGTANTKFSIGNGMVNVVPVGAPIVFAIVACSPGQAMLVAIAGFLPNISAAREQGMLINVQSAGVGATVAGFTSLIVHLAGGTFTSPGIAFATTIGCAWLYLTLDVVAYGTWDVVDGGSASALVRYYRTAVPLDIAMTGTAVLLAAPFHDAPLAVGGILAGYTLAIAAINKVAASENLHRTKSEHLRDVFSRYVPDSVADRLADGDAEIRLGGETRFVTVLFCDIRGFTSWSEKHDAAVVVEELNQLLGAMTEAVMRNEGTLDKFTGDGLMAFWGAPLDQPEHAAMACAAAADIHAALAECNERRAEKGMEAFAIGVGVATGDAVVGNIGHERRLDYTAIGDTVNTSARLEAATKELEVATVISGATAAMLPPDTLHGFEQLGAIAVKGKREPVVVWGGGGSAGRAADEAEAQEPAA